MPSWVGASGGYDPYFLQRKNMDDGIKNIASTCTCEFCYKLINITPTSVASSSIFRCRITFATSDEYKCSKNRTEIRALIAASLITDPDFLGPYFK